MKQLYFAFILLTVCFCGTPLKAQILDDEAPFADTAVSLDDETDESEAFFNEAFEEHLAKEHNAPKKETLDSSLNKAAQAIKSSGVPLGKVEKTEKIEPLSGDILIGVSKGSFKVFQDMTGRTTCSFGVTVKSGLDRELRTMGLRLVWQNREFAFVFREVPANGMQERFIITHGDFCYALAGVPDIDINMCKIKGAKNDECAKRIKWDATLKSPDPSKSPYPY